MQKRILIVDDEPDFTHLMKVSLEANGNYIVREENDPARALEVAREFMPDLLLLDLMMPGLDGSDVAAMFMADPELRGVPLVFLTALVRGDDASSGTRDSSNRLMLPKSLSVLRLTNYIEAALSRAKLNS